MADTSAGQQDPPGPALAVEPRLCLPTASGNIQGNDWRPDRTVTKPSSPRKHGVSCFVKIGRFAGRQKDLIEERSIDQCMAVLIGRWSLCAPSSDVPVARGLFPERPAPCARHPEGRALCKPDRRRNHLQATVGIQHWRQPKPLPVAQSKTRLHATGTACFRQLHLVGVKLAKQEVYFMNIIPVLGLKYC